MWGEQEWVHTSFMLTSLFPKKTTVLGKYGDGHGLDLIVDASGTKRWEQRLVIQGRHRDIGLGNAVLVCLRRSRGWLDIILGCFLKIKYGVLHRHLNADFGR